MDRLNGIVALALAAVSGGALGSGPEVLPPAFTKKPTATKEDGNVLIVFAVNRETDVAVFIEDAHVKIVRHLVAEVLGKNPPEPLKANSLAQSIALVRRAHGSSGRPGLRAASGKDDRADRSGGCRSH